MLSIPSLLSVALFYGLSHALKPRKPCGCGAWDAMGEVLLLRARPQREPHVELADGANLEQEVVVRATLLRDPQDLARVVGLAGMEATFVVVVDELKAVPGPIDIEGVRAVRVVEQVLDIGVNLVAAPHLVGADNLAVLRQDAGRLPAVAVRGCAICLLGTAVRDPLVAPFQRVTMVFQPVLHGLRHVVPVGEDNAMLRRVISRLAVGLTPIQVTTCTLFEKALDCL